uniref:Uncharacterized protein n=1 Tax=Oryza punctata TaxID=4537 RepID=A0A0E0MMS1_ORYPU
MAGARRRGELGEAEGRELVSTEIRKQSYNYRIRSYTGIISRVAVAGNAGGGRKRAERRPLVKGRSGGDGKLTEGSAPPLASGGRERRRRRASATATVDPLRWRRRHLHVVELRAPSGAAVATARGGAT